MSVTEQSLWQSLAHAVCGQETSLESIEDETILRQAEFHGISPLLHKQVQAGTIQGLTDPAKAQLKTAAYAHVAADMILNESTRKTLDLLAAHDIPALLLKGTAVAHLYYENSHERVRADTDLYIRETDVKKAAEVLGKHNYEVNEFRNRKYSSKQFVAALPAPQTQFVHFDVHWKVSNRVMFGNVLSFDASYQNRQAVPALGPNVHCPAKIDLLIHACIHRIAHLRNTASHRLIWLYDIHLIIGSMNDDELDQFQQKAKQKAVGVVCAEALEVSQNLFGTKLPSQYLDLLKENASRERSAKLLHASKLRWAWEDLQSLGSLKEKAAFARELFFG